MRTTNVADVSPLKAEHGVPGRVTSCHTAVVDGYVVEGHVPAEDIERLLDERPDIAGISVPGMPVGAPGMEGPNPKGFAVISFDDDGELAVFSEHKP
ncbi:MAG: CopG family transcriptional regulator [Acidobacteria bacterium]|nr:CopG family transcriptional regulator [Acidobacteriota bacterium]MDP7337864.1 DUF411 domain-containing protein [Vicinamibacterales bacterium]MDP7480496.1 DUF411 domain-containing protein [Vicinamibacterales bacterium]MDP7693122.1 DUF411 domain-containing protein [Vicinamibacterales bacterium]HJN45884.1 DUF411 domain-containing protein [Vicinamibacterales bacterium]